MMNVTTYEVETQEETTGEVLSSVVTVENVFHAQLYLETDLTEDGFKSPVYLLHHDTFVSKWQIEVNPNHVDSEGTRHLSYWLRLISSSDPEVPACFNPTLITSSEENEPDYVKQGALVKFSQENPIYGFPCFVEMYKLRGNPESTLSFQLSLSTFQAVETLDLDWTPQDPFDSPINHDTSVTWKNHNILVDSARLSYFSPIFRTYYEGQDLAELEPMEMSSYCESVAMAKLVVFFCHHKHLGKETRSIRALIMLGRIANQLLIEELEQLCLTSIVEGMTPKRFMDAVNCLCDDGTDAFSDTILPFLTEYLFTNFDDIKYNKKYQQSYEKYQDLYTACLLDLNQSGSDDSSDQNMFD